MAKFYIAPKVLENELYLKRKCLKLSKLDQTVEISSKKKNHEVET